MMSKWYQSPDVPSEYQDLFSNLHNFPLEFIQIYSPAGDCKQVIPLDIDFEETKVEANDDDLIFQAQTPLPIFAKLPVSEGSKVIGTYFNKGFPVFQIAKKTDGKYYAYSLENNLSRPFRASNLQLLIDGLSERLSNQRT